jgi:ferredoxin
MASGSRSLPALALLAFCALSLRTVLPSGFAMAGRSSTFAKPIARRGVAAHYKVLLETEDGPVAFDCPPDRSLLSVIREQSPMGSHQQPGSWACEEGQCTSCLGHIVSGTVEQNENTFLSEEMKKDGFCLSCQSKPTSDLVINAMFMHDDHWSDAMLDDLE